MHCHAGTGRTALVIASFLFYVGLAVSAEEAIAITKRDRPGSLAKKSQVNFVIQFCNNWLSYKRFSLFPTVLDKPRNLNRSCSPNRGLLSQLSSFSGEKSLKIKDSEKFTYFQTMVYQKELLHGECTTKF